MKKLFLLLIAAIILIIYFSSCNGENKKVEEQKKKKLAELREEADTTIYFHDDENIFNNDLFLTGVIFLEGECKESSPRITFGFTKNSDYFVSLILLKSFNVPNAPSDRVPVEIAIKVKEIVSKNSQDFYFKTNPKGYVFYGIGNFLDENNLSDTSLEQALNLLNAIEKETGWKIAKGEWQAN